MTDGQFETPEEMGPFFDGRSSGYDAHMREVLGSRFTPFYDAVADAIDRTDADIHVLDLGAGTGAELEGVLAHAPRARVTCIDVSSNMLARLQQRHSRFADRITCVRGSFLDLAFPHATQAYVVSVMAMHHYTRARKRALYRRIRQALTPAGRFVLGDYFVPRDEERRCLLEYRRAAGDGAVSPGTLYHLDIPCSVPRRPACCETQASRRCTSRSRPKTPPSWWRTEVEPTGSTGHSPVIVARPRARASAAGGTVAGARHSDPMSCTCPRGRRSRVRCAWRVAGRPRDSW